MAAVSAERLIGIVRAPDLGAARRSLAAMRAAGVRVAEVSLSTPGALDVLAAEAASSGPDHLIGAGTVLDAAAARSAVAAGAQFLVAPIVVREVVLTALDLGVVVVPGCATPTEMVQALRWGAQLVKLFPANAWTPVVLRTMLHALPDMRVVPTGGITLADAPQWLAAGAVAVGVGSALTADACPDEVRRAVATLRLTPSAGEQGTPAFPQMPAGGEEQS